MFSSFIITFRETLEAALVIGIILGYLHKIKQERYNNVVYLGVGAGILASIIGALLFNLLAGGFEGKAEEIFEGITMLLGAVLLSFMILWMLKQRHIAKDIESKVAKTIHHTHRTGLFLLVFVSVLREGIETVIFLQAASFVSQESNLYGALLGVFGAMLLGYILFVAAKKVNLRPFFTATSVLLILFAAGLVAHSVHEFEEAGILPEPIEHLWDVNTFINEESHLGLLLKGLFGYNGDPSLLEALSYVLYLAIMVVSWQKIHSKPSASF